MESPLIRNPLNYTLCCGLWSGKPSGLTPWRSFHTTTPNLILKKAGNLGDHRSPTTEFTHKTTSKCREEAQVQVSFPSGSPTDSTPWGERGTHSETLPWATTLCWLGSGCACARPPTHRSSQRNTAVQISSGAQLRGGRIPAHRGAPAQSPNPRLDAIQHAGQHARGLTERTLRKFALTFFVLLLNDAVSSRRKHFFPAG